MHTTHTHTHTRMPHAYAGTHMHVCMQLYIYWIGAFIIRMYHAQEW